MISTSEVTVTLRGIGGVGKSTIAKAVCYEKSMMEYFTDGFLWISLTPPHNVTDELCLIYNKLTNQPVEGTQSFVKDKIKLYLMSNTFKFLVILDDVWDAEDALVYIEVFSRCKILLTTRRSDIDAEIQTKNPIDIKTMELNEAVELLTHGIDGFNILDDNDKAMLHKLAEDLHCWPLLLNLVRTQLYIYCSGQNMTPRKSMLLANQKLCKSFTAFDKTSREKAVKVCLDTSLNLLPRQDIRVLRCIALAIGGFGPYAIKVTIEKASKMNSEQFNTCESNLWSHGLIELIDIPIYPTNQCISCIGVHHIIAHYITETISPEQLFEIIGDFDILISVDELIKIYDQNEATLLNNSGTALLHLILNMMLFVMRALLVLACLLERSLHFLHSGAIADNLKTNSELTMENMFSTIQKDCAKIVSLLTSNKHSDAIKWLKTHFRNHPLSLMCENIYLTELKFIVENALDCRLVPVITLHRCVGALMKVKASNEDIMHCWDCFYMIT